MKMRALRKSVIRQDYVQESMLGMGPRFTIIFSKTSAFISIQCNNILHFQSLTLTHSIMKSSQSHKSYPLTQKYQFLGTASFNPDMKASVLLNRQNSKKKLKERKTMLLRDLDKQNDTLFWFTPI